ncbi:MnhB domain-containing protein [Oryzibacter oryziterrae]|uniref:MnhB domain-containing protein n=1 Tax=Oryzibacter oryziterrae TaxID=2766474 RepID=UPI001F3AA274|nr:MnhB domain-containing protein [Oryzibacter oryziterrae]
MGTVIFRTLSPLISALTLMLAVFVTLRGHNDPGGGFIGGLIAASAFALLGLSHGVPAVRQALRFHPMSYAGFGLLLAVCAGLLPIFTGRSFFTALWTFPQVLGVEIALSTPMFFDIGVFFVVSGAMTSIALSLEQRGGGV